MERLVTSYQRVVGIASKQWGQCGPCRQQHRGKAYIWILLCIFCLNDWDHRTPLSTLQFEHLSSRNAAPSLPSRTPDSIDKLVAAGPWRFPIVHLDFLVNRPFSFLCYWLPVFGTYIQGVSNNHTIAWVDTREQVHHPLKVNIKRSSREKTRKCVQGRY